MLKFRITRFINKSEEVTHEEFMSYVALCVKERYVFDAGLMNDEDVFNIEHLSGYAFNDVFHSVDNVNKLISNSLFKIKSRDGSC